MRVLFFHILVSTYVINYINGLDSLPSLDPVCPLSRDFAAPPTEEGRCSPLQTSGLAVDMLCRIGSRLNSTELLSRAVLPGEIPPDPCTCSWRAALTQWRSGRASESSRGFLLAAAMSAVGDPSFKQSPKALGQFCFFTDTLFKSRLHPLSLSVYLNSLTLQPTSLCFSVWYQAEKFLWPPTVEMAMRS